MKSVHDVVIEELKKSTGLEVVEDHMSIFDDLNLSSLEAFEMIANIEEILEIEIDEEEIGEVVTVADMVEAIENIVNR